MTIVDEKQAQYAGEILQIISATPSANELELTVAGNAYGLLMRFVVTCGKSTFRMRLDKEARSMQLR